MIRKFKKGKSSHWKQQQKKKLEVAYAVASRNLLTPPIPHALLLVRVITSFSMHSTFLTHIFLSQPEYFNNLLKWDQEIHFCTWFVRSLFVCCFKNPEEIICCFGGKSFTNHEVWCFTSHLLQKPDQPPTLLISGHIRSHLQHREKSDPYSDWKSDGPSLNNRIICIEYLGYRSFKTPLIKRRICILLSWTLNDTRELPSDKANLKYIPQYVILNNLKRHTLLFIPHIRCHLNSTRLTLRTSFSSLLLLTG